VRSGARLHELRPILVSLDDLDEDEQLEDHSCWAEQRKVEARIDIERARALASPVVARAITLLWEEDWGYEAAAVAVGINRLTLRRQLLQLGSRLAAV
jgi:DNA-directed RNA polymerase specialized sigma24 family protein